MNNKGQFLKIWYITLQLEGFTPSTHEAISLSEVLITVVIHLVIIFHCFYSFFPLTVCREPLMSSLPFGLFSMKWVSVAVHSLCLLFSCAFWFHFFHPFFLMVEPPCGQQKCSQPPDWQFQKATFFFFFVKWIIHQHSDLNGCNCCQSM